MKINTINEGEFYKILESEELFVADFSANWCCECADADKILSDFSRENPGLKIYRIDVEECTDIANRYNVINVPSVLVFNRKAVKSRSDGKFTFEELSRLI